MNDILVKVGADISQFSSAMSSATRDLQNLGRANTDTFSSFNKVGSALTNSITKPAVVATGAAVGLTSALGFKRLVGMDSAKAKLEGLGYSGKDTERIMYQVENAVQGGMTTMAEGADIAAGAMAAGVSEGKDLEKYIKLVGDAAVGSNRPVAEMAQIFNRVQGGGKLMTQELNQIEHSMPGFSAAMSEHLGVSQQEFRKMVTAGEVSSKDFLVVMDDFAGGMAEAYSKSWDGMVKNTFAYIGIIGEALLEGLFEDGKETLAKFVEVLKSEEIQEWARDTGEIIRDITRGWAESISELKSWYDDLSPSVQQTVQVLAILSTVGLIALGPLLKMIGAIPALIEGFIAVITVVKAVGSAFVGLSLPMMATIVVIGLIIAAVVNLWRTNEEFRNNIYSIWESILTLITFVWQAIQPGAIAFIQVLGILIGVLGTLIGWIVGVIAVVLEWVVAFIQANQWIITVAQVIGIIIGVIAGLVTAVMVVVKIFTVLVSIIKIVAAVIMFFTSPVGIAIAIVAALGGVLVWLGSKFEWLGNIIDKAANFMKSAWEGFLGIFGKGTKDAADEASDAIEETSEKGKESMDDLATSGTESATELKEGVSSEIGEMTDLASLDLEDFNIEGLDALQGLEMDGIDAMSGMNDGVLSEIGDMSDLSIEDLQGLEIDGIDAMSGLESGVTTEVGAMADEVKSDVSDMESKASGDFSGLASDMTSNANKVRGEVSKAFSGMGSDVSKQMISISRAAHTGMLAVSLSISQGMTLATKTMQASMQAISRNMAQSFTLINKTVQASFTAINSQAKSGTSKLNNTVAKSNTLTIKSYQVSYQAVGRAVSSGMSSAVSAVQRANLFIVANVRALNGQFYSAGVHAMSGLRGGLNAGAGAVISTARTIANRVASTIRAALKVKSPSRVMMDIGRWTSIGLAEGMDKYAGAVVKSADNLATAATPSIDMSYATPHGTQASLASAVRGTVDVNNRDERLAGAINSLERRLGDLEVVMDGERVGRIVRPHINDQDAVEAMTRRYFD